MCELKWGVRAKRILINILIFWQPFTGDVVIVVFSFSLRTASGIKAGEPCTRRGIGNKCVQTSWVNRSKCPRHALTRGGDCGRFNDSRGVGCGRFNDREINVLFNDALNTFYLRLYGVSGLLIAAVRAAAGLSIAVERTAARLRIAVERTTAGLRNG